MGEILIAAALLLLGGAAGWFLRDRQERAARAATAEAPGERERRRLREDHQAFETLMGYNADMAYGLDRVKSAEETD